jgi:hypothetical protein
MDKRPSFNMGIKELKRVLDRMDMPKTEKNRTIKLYKERLYTRVEEVKEKMKDVGTLPDEQSSLSNATASAEYITSRGYYKCHR